MFSNLHELVKDAPAVQAALGNPVRLYRFGQAPQDGPKPYAVQQTIAGTPELYVNQVPDQDSLVVQVDVYAAAMADARAAVTALVNAIGMQAHVTSWNGEFYEPETKLHRISFTVDLKVDR